jgi:hypothetical protein
MEMRPSKVCVGQRGSKCGCRQRAPAGAGTPHRWAGMQAPPPQRIRSSACHPTPISRAHTATIEYALPHAEQRHRQGQVPSGEHKHTHTHVRVGRHRARQLTMYTCHLLVMFSTCACTQRWRAAARQQLRSTQKTPKQARNRRHAGKRARRHSRASPAAALGWRRTSRAWCRVRQQQQRQRTLVRPVYENMPICFSTCSQPPGAPTAGGRRRRRQGQGRSGPAGGRA